jgi:hypothetical protein
MPPLQIALLLLQVLPGLIMDAEALFMQKPNSGPQKKAAVLDAIKHGLHIASFFGVKELQPQETKDQILTAAGSITDAVVGGLNNGNLLGHAAPQA